MGQWRWWAMVMLLVTSGLVQAQGAEPARIFALNLFALPMDVQWGSEGTWKAEGLFSRAVSRAALVEPGVARTIHFRRAGLTGWSTAKDEDGRPRTLALEPGAVYVLVVRPNGNGDLVRVAAPATPAPKVLFVNAAKGPAAQFRLGAVADGLEPGWGAFVDAEPGIRTLTWSWPVMPPGTEVYKATSAQPGQPGTTNLANGRWYVAVVSSVYGVVTEITP